MAERVGFTDHCMATVYYKYTYLMIMGHHEFGSSMVKDIIVHNFAAHDLNFGFPLKCYSSFKKFAKLHKRH